MGGSALLETRWCVVVEGWSEAYITNFGAIADPSLFAEDERTLHLRSTSFEQCDDYESVLDRARDVVTLLVGALHIRQDPGPLTIIKIFERRPDGEVKEWPPYGRPVSVTFGLGTSTGWTPRPHQTFEEAIVKFCLKEMDTFVQEVLHFMADPNWYNLYKVTEIIRYELRLAGFKRSRNREAVSVRGWCTQRDLDRFATSAQFHRHYGEARPTMTLFEARQLIGGIIGRWIRDVAERREALRR